MARGRSTPADRIFISYRREDTAYPAGWLFDRLAAEFGDAQVFKDVDSIDLGDDFVDVISAAVGSTDVLLALIGEEWLTAADEQGKRRLDDPDDFVRLEIEAALAREVRVIPILVDGARMPRADELPVTIAALARRQALELSPDRFEFDTSRLLKVLRKTLAEQRIRQPPGTSSAGAGERHRVDGKDADGAPAPRGPASGGSSSAVPDARAPADRLKHFRARPRLLIATGLAVVLVAVLIGIVVVNSGGDAPPSGDSDGKTTPARNGEGQSGAAIPFTDDFSSSKSGWDDAGDSPIGGHYEGGAYRIFAERAPDRWGVSASPGIPASAADLRIGVSARRIGGSAAEKYGYGVFCRADGPDNFYAFTIWANHASIAKRVDGGYVPLGEPNPDVSSAVHGDGNKELRAVCTTVGQRAVDLQFWVNDEIILSRTDREDPYESGTFGVQVALGRAGPTGDTLEVEFDDFAVSEE